MADLSKLSDDDLIALKGGDLSKVSDAGLLALKGTSPVQEFNKGPMTATERFKQGLKDPIEGGAQLLTNMLPSGLVRAGDRLNNFIADKTGLVARLPEGGVDAQVRANEAEYKRRNAGVGMDWARLGGNVLNPVNAALGAGLPQAATLAGRVGVGTVGGALSSMLNPVAEGNFAEEKAKQMGLGAVSGGAVPVVASGLARVVSPKASTSPDIALLRSEGVRPTVGQTLGGVFNTVEEKAQSLPLVGDAIRTGRRRAVEQFNEAAINRATGKVGSNVRGAGHDAVRQAGDEIGAVYDKAYSMLGNFQVDQQGQNTLQTIRQMAAQLPRKEQREFNTVWQTIQGELTPQGHLLSDGYQRVREMLGKKAVQFTGSNDGYQRQLGEALKEMDKALTANARRANPAASQLLDQADAAWANLVRVEGAANLGKRADGVFTPGQLVSAVKSADKSVRDRATARGNALMQDLGRAGQKVLGDVVPDSGTAGRSLLGLGLVGAAAPVSLPLAVGYGAPSLMYMRPAQNALSGLLSTRPQAAQGIAEMLRQASPYFVPAGAQVGLQLAE